MSVMSESAMLGSTLYSINQIDSSDVHRVFDYLSTLLKFTKADLSQHYSKTGVPILFNRFEFCLNDLNMAKLVARSTGEVWITKYGQQMLTQYSDYHDIDEDVVHDLPAYKRSFAKSKAKIKRNRINNTQSNPITLTEIGDFVDKYNNNIKCQLLFTLQAMDPFEFEHVVGQLLSKMGYSISENSLHVTKKTGDGGVDGFLSFDVLGLRHIYFQAKRYSSSNIVDRDAIQGFYGALHTTYHVDVGIFITTSDFSDGARKVADSSNIRLINGQQLVDFMLKFGVMVSPRQKFTVYKLN